MKQQFKRITKNERHFLKSISGSSTSGGSYSSTSVSSASCTPPVCGRNMWEYGNSEEGHTTHPQQAKLDCSGMWNISDCRRGSAGNEQHLTAHEQGSSGDSISGGSGNSSGSVNKTKTFKNKIASQTQPIGDTQ